MLVFYDIECFSKLWTVTLIIPSEYKTIQIVNNFDEVKDLYKRYKNFIWIAYNGRNYDQYMIKTMLLEFDPKKLNDFIIKENRNGWEYSSEFNKIPLVTYDCMVDDTSLKKLEGFMGSDIRECDIEFDYDGEFTKEMVDEVLSYNLRDVKEMMEVFLLTKNEFNSQLALVKEFNLPLRDIGKTQAQLAAKILGAVKVIRNDEWNIRLPIELELHKYKYIADWFMNKENQNYKCSLTTNVCGVEHTFAYGGGHGAIPNFIYECKDDEMMIMSDIAQMYPHLMTGHNLISRNATKPEQFNFILSESMRLKALGEKKKRVPYKRVCNIVYGAMGDKYNSLYDPLHRNLVCVYGQVLMVMLLEKLEVVPSFKLIQNNTDGILFLIKTKDFDLVDDIIYEWEQKTRLKMEFEYFDKVIQGDVNNYIAIKNDGKTKGKGAYFKDLSPIDNDLPIINKAIKDYLINNIPVEDTIYGCDDFMQFQQIVRVSSKYMYAMHGNKKLKEKTLRVYASKDKQDEGIYKVKDIDGSLRVEKAASTPKNAFIFNKKVRGLKCPSKLDKKWYVDLAYYRISKKVPDVIN